MNTLPDFRLLFESVPAPILALAPDSPRFTVLAASDAYLRVTKKQREEIVGRPVFKVFPDDSDQPSGNETGSRASFERVLQRRQPDRQDLRRHDIQRPESEGGGFETRFWSPLNTPVLDENGGVRYIIHLVEDVTELVRARQQDEGGGANVSSAREVRHAALFKKSPCALALIRMPEGRVVDANDAFLSLFESDRKSVIGKTVVESDILDAESLTRVVKDLQRQGSVRNAEIAHGGRDGSRTFLLNLDWVSIGGEQTLLASIEDITERKRTEEALRLAAMVFQNTGEAMTVTDESNRIVSVNPAFERITGYAAAEVIGKDPKILSSGRHDKEFYQAMWQSLASTGNWKGEIWNKTKDGSEYAELLTINTAFNPDGSVNKRVALFTDITGRKQAEDALRTIFNSTYDATILHEADGAITDVNETFLRLYGAGSVQQARALSIYDISSPAAPMEQLPGIWNKVAAAGPQFFEWKARRVDDGREFDAEVFLRPIRLYGREMILANVRDISERKRTQGELQELTLTLEQRVRDRTAALEMANKELEAFSYSVSHDLRAPLRGIDGFSRLLQERHADKLDANGQDYLNRIRNAALRMGRLIEDMLRLSRIGRTEIRKTSVNLTEMANSVANDLRQREPARKVEVEVAPGLVAYADAGLLRIVLENLLGNAFKFTSRKENARIEVGAIDKDSERVYYVRDNGAGFDMAYAEKLFSPFQRLHKDTEFAGSGIGLASVQRIIARHGGRIWPDAKEGQGATFYFTLGK